MGPKATAESKAQPEKPVDKLVPAAAGDEDEPLDLIAQDAAADHILQFRSPVYVAAWLDDRHCVVGGGGGSRFGMKNGLAVLAVCPTQASTPADAAGSTAPSSSKADPPLWRHARSVDLRQNIVWCLSNTEDASAAATTSSALTTTTTPDAGTASADAPEAAAAPSTSSGNAKSVEAGSRDVLFCVSHLDSFTLVRATGVRPHTAVPAPTRQLPPPVLSKVCRVALVSDSQETGEPEKKPVAMAGGLIFAAQDNNSVAVLRTAALLAAPVPSDAAASASVSDNGSFAAFDVAAAAATSSNVVIATLDIGARVNDLSARAVPWQANSGLVIIFAACKDKTARIFHINSADGSVLRKFTLNGAALGFGADKTLLRSSLRITSSFEQQLPVTDRLAAPQPGVGSGFDSDKRQVGAAAAQAAQDRPKKQEFVNVVFLLFSLVDGVAYMQRIFCKHDKIDQPLVEKPFKIGTEAPTAVSVSRVAGTQRFTNITVAFADGCVAEVREEAKKPLKVQRRRAGLHGEPISAVAAHSNGAVVTADIAQRVILSFAGLHDRPRQAAMTLYPAQQGAAFLRVWGRRVLAVSVAITAVLAARHPMQRFVTSDATAARGSSASGSHEL